MALIEVQHLKKYFDVPNGTLHAVDDVSFKIEKGTTMGVVGESGCMEPTDANPAAGAARELFEETGYAGSEPVFLCKVAPNAACISNFAHCYLIRDCKKVSSQHLDATEDLEIIVMSAEETKKLMAEGGLVQAVHVAAMYYAEKILNK